jgi:hypothetical protein
VEVFIVFVTDFHPNESLFYGSEGGRLCDTLIVLTWLMRLTQNHWYDSGLRELIYERKVYARFSGRRLRCSNMP